MSGAGQVRTTLVENLKELHLPASATASRKRRGGRRRKRSVTSSICWSWRSGNEPRWIAACRSQDRVVVHGDKFAIARDQIADQCGLAALARPSNHNHRRFLERGGHQFGGKARN